MLSATISVTGRPMFPPTSVGRPAAFKISPTSVVVVVFPFDPVIATTSPCKNCAPQLQLANDRASPSRAPASAPARRHRHTRAHHNQILPPKRQQPMAPRLHHESLHPAAPAAPQSASPAAHRSPSPAPHAPSKTAPPPARSSPAQPPARVCSSSPHARSSTLYISLRSALPQLQRRQRKQRKHQRHNPEPRNHLRLRLHPINSK